MILRFFSKNHLLLQDVVRVRARASWTPGMFHSLGFFQRHNRGTRRGPQTRRKPQQHTGHEKGRWKARAAPANHPQPDGQKTTSLLKKRARSTDTGTAETIHSSGAMGNHEHSATPRGGHLGSSAPCRRATSVAQGLRPRAARKAPRRARVRGRRTEDGAAAALHGSRGRKNGRTGASAVSIPEPAKGQAGGVTGRQGAWSPRPRSRCRMAGRQRAQHHVRGAASRNPF